MAEPSANPIAESKEWRELQEEINRLHNERLDALMLASFPYWNPFGLLPY